MLRLFIIFFALVLITKTVMAFEYVLPYPSYMPGHQLYYVSYVLDVLKQYWHWGTLATITYRMNLADKNLVEAKTLFEYKQYLLAVNALKRSDKNVSVLAPLLIKAKGEGKNIRQMTKQVVGELESHIAILDAVQRSMPNTFFWQPEKLPPTQLDLNTDIQEAITIRNQTKNSLISF